jgi:hypothetical protein
MALNTKIRGNQIADAFFGDGVQRNALDANILEVSVDNSTLEISSDALQVKEGGIDTTQLAEEAVTEAKLDIYNSPTEGQLLGYTANGLEWVTGVSEAVNEEDIAVENLSADCDGSKVEFTLSDTPVASSVQVFLNGLLQEEGSGKDYALAGDVVAFVEAPLSGDILIVHYVINN